MKRSAKKRPFYRRKAFLWPMSVILGLIILTILAFRLSPWPGAFVVRMVFDRGAEKTLHAMEAALPDYPVTVLSDEQYRKDDKAAYLDVYVPNAVLETDQRLPVVIWTHGGAWLSGDKKNAAPYFSRLADQGFVVVSLNYSLAPGKTYPTPVHQLNDAYGYVAANAARFNADSQKIVLAGDSAGAQLSSQMAALLTNPDYAKELGITPSVTPSQLAGVVLYCGIYKVEGLTQPDPTVPKIVGWGSDVTVWAYTGSRDKTDPAVQQMSAFYHVSSAFPTTFISGGNADPLTNAQSIPFAQELQGLGVNVTSLFYPADHTPGLPHEYQFTFNSDGENAFTQMVQFLQAKTQ